MLPGGNGFKPVRPLSGAIRRRSAEVHEEAARPLELSYLPSEGVVKYSFRAQTPGLMGFSPAFRLRFVGRRFGINLTVADETPATNTITA
jgi:hypothetical protein